MSAETETGGDVEAPADSSPKRHRRGYLPDVQFTMGERARYIRSAWNQSETPPTTEEAAAKSEHNARYLMHSDTDCWDDILRQAGVPGRDELIAGTIREMYRGRHPWQAYITVYSKDVKETLDIHSGYIGHILSHLADGSRTPSEMEGIRLDRANDTTPKLWAVTDGERDGPVPGSVAGRGRSD